MRYFLPHYVSEEADDDARRWVAGADWHQQWDREVFGTLGQGIWHTHLAPRGYAKSTKVGVATMLAVLGLSGLAIEGKLPYPFKARHYCWLIQDTSAQAAQSMSALITETEDNARVRKWFPHLKPARDAKNMPIADRDDDVVFQLGLRLQALGAGQKLRGRRHRQYRPDFALIDDLENDESVLTKYQRDKLDKWLSSAFSFAVAKGADVHYVGTLLHQDAVLARVRKRGGWRNHRYDAFRRGEFMPCPDHGWRVDENDPIEPDTLDEDGVACDLCRGKHEVAVPSWGYRDCYWHAQQRKRTGRTAYSREILHVVTDEERKRFPASRFRYGPTLEPVVGDGRADGTVTKDVRGVSVRIVVDPNAAEKEDGDPAAIVVVMKRRGERTFHVDYAYGGPGCGARRCANASWRCTATTSSRATGRSSASRKCRRRRGVCRSSRTPGSRPRRQAWRQGQVHPLRRSGAALRNEPRHPPRAAARQRLRDVMDEFPDGEHDDFVDCVVYGIKDLEDGGDPGAGVAGVVVVGGKERAKRKRDSRDAFRDPRFA
jgi:hypothetical protein